VPAGPSDFGFETSPLQLDLPIRPESVAVARHAVERYAEAQGIDGQRVALAVSEAVTNALVHGSRDQSRDISVRLAAHLQGDALLVSVADDGPGVKPDLQRDPLRLGLILIAAAADSMCIETPAGAGTRVVMRFR
jgi:anti-sigma regulatory factor (Ser/Thr protein kinase)